MPPRIAVFCMPEPGHFQLLRPLIAGLASHGADVSVFTALQYQPQVQEAGAGFVDLFARYSLDSADHDSTPFPCRYVSYAGCYARQVAEEVRQFGPSLIIYETFALVGRVVSGLLKVPWVNVSPGHDLDPTQCVRRLEADPRVNVSSSCRLAVASLRERHGLLEASPFSFVTELSPYLNICCEPPAFVTEAQRQVFAPLACFGSLPSAAAVEPNAPEGALSYFADRSRLKVYASFGTIVWRYYQQEAFAALLAISRYVAGRSDTEALISLGHGVLEPAARRQLTGDNVRVETYVDQPAVLREADLSVTHHGINSTHESIANRVPMLSYPFFWDQPALAAKCQAMGLALPLGGSLRGGLDETVVASAVEALSRGAGPRRARLERAREDEFAVIAGRDAILRRLMELAAGGSPGARIPA